MAVAQAIAPERIIASVEAALGARIKDVKEPKQGMGSSVLILTDGGGREMAVKVGTETANDILALELVRSSGADVPVPGVLASFPCEGMTVLVMEKVDAPLLEEVGAGGEAALPRFHASLFGKYPCHKIRPGGTPDRRGWR